MSFPTLLKNGARAAVVALTLGGTALTAMPVQAAPALGFSFSFGNGGMYGGPGMYQDYNDHMMSCMTNRQVRFQLRQHGWYNLQVIRSGQFNVILVGQRNGKWFQIRVNRCNGNTDIRPVSKKKSGGFSITLSF
jgi:hypothetical protein